MNPSIYVPLWEGTTNVLSLDALRAISKEDALPPFLEMLQASAKKATDPGLAKPARAALEAAEHAVAWLKGAMAQGVPLVEAGARRFAMTLGRSMELALLLEQAQWDIDFKKDGRSAAAARRFARNGVDLIAEDEDLDEARALAMDSELVL